jgi:hypothetical protein
MNQAKVVFILFTILVTQSSCYAPTQTYPDKMPTPIYPVVPLEVEQEKEYSFSIKTSPNAICHAAIGFWDIAENWIQEELPIIKADNLGVCQWKWKTPDNAKNGIAEFRGFIELET